MLTWLALYTVHTQIQSPMLEESGESVLGRAGEAAAERGALGETAVAREATGEGDRCEVLPASAKCCWFLAAFLCFIERTLEKVSGSPAFLTGRPSIFLSLECFACSMRERYCGMHRACVTSNPSREQLAKGRIVLTETLASIRTLETTNQSFQFYASARK